jgi:hypothetical protein
MTSTWLVEGHYRVSFVFGRKRRVQNHRLAYIVTYYLSFVIIFKRKEMHRMTSNRCDMTFASMTRIFKICVSSHIAAPLSLGIPGSRLGG